jgi:hypothetical protein
LERLVTGRPVVGRPLDEEPDATIEVMLRRRRSTVRQNLIKPIDLVL